MKVARPQLAAFTAFVLAGVVVLAGALDISGLLKVMLDQALSPERYPFLPGVAADAAFALVPLILWVALCTTLWPFVGATAGRPFMVAALVALSFAAIVEVSLALLSPLVAVPSPEPIGATVTFARVANVLFGVFLAVALWRSGLFPPLVTSVGMAWAGVRALSLASGMLQPLDADLVAGVPGMMIGFVPSALLTAFLILLGRELLVSEVCLTGAST